MIKLRLDVDYPYPSRLQSFVFAALKSKTGKNYLKNSKIIAKMINESPEGVKAYWFFTPQTTPDVELLSLLHPDRHEVALHVANKAFAELESLENATKRKVKYYTVHGTARLLARLMWRRSIRQAKAPIPEGFPLKSFYDFPTLYAVDYICYHNSPEQALKIVEKGIAEGKILHFHPEWLFQRGIINQRGPYYETLKTVLRVDAELEAMLVRKRAFAKIASYAGAKEYEQDSVPTQRFLAKLAERGVDIFTFIERKWCCPVANPPEDWVKAEDNIGLLHVTTYNEWWNGIGKKTRNMIRKAEKSGVITIVTDPNGKMAEGVWKIYNETPIRQGRAFPHFGMPLESVKRSVLSWRNSTFIGAFFQDELIGFIQLVHGDNVAIISQILSLTKFWDKAVNNALVAKAIEVCAANQIHWVMYGRMGNHPSLDTFKQSNSFQRFSLTRFYVPLTRKGRIATKLGLHRELKDALPQSVKRPLFPLFNWLSRTRMRLSRRLR